MLSIVNRLCFQGRLCFQEYAYAFDSESLMLSTVRLCFQVYAYAFKCTLMLSRVRLCFQVYAYAFKCTLMLSSVNGFCLTFFKPGCLGYLYLTVDVYNSHFCHLKFYPQNRLYFQNITNERKSILFIIPEVLTAANSYVTDEVMWCARMLYSKIRQKVVRGTSTRGRSLLSTVNVATFIQCLSNILQSSVFWYVCRKF